MVLGPGHSGLAVGRPRGDSRIRVLAVSHSALLNGAQRSLLDLLVGMDRARFDLVVAAANEGPLNQRLLDASIPVHLVPIEHWVAFGGRSKLPWRARAVSTLSGLASRVRVLAQLIERLNVDVVYTNTITVVEAALAARMTRRPHVWHVREVLRGNPDLAPLLPAWATARLVNWLSDGIVANSGPTRCPAAVPSPSSTTG